MEKCSGDHGLYYKAINMYESAIHIPCIIHYPKALKPKRYKEPIEALHLAPTMVEAAGLPAEPGMQTRSIWQKLLDSSEIEGEDIYCEYYNSLKEIRLPSAENCATMIRTGDYKLIAYHGTKEGELYDLNKDPNESTNLFSNDEYMNVKTDMLMRLSNKMALVC